MRAKGGGDAAGRPPLASRKVPVVVAAAMTPIHDVVDASYVRTMLPEGSLRGLDGPDPSSMLEAQPAADESLMSSPLAPKHAAVMQRPVSEVQTKTTSSENVDTMLPRRLAALQRRIAATNAPPLPPEMGHLQRSAQRQGTVWLVLVVLICSLLQILSAYMRLIKRVRYVLGQPLPQP